MKIVRSPAGEQVKNRVSLYGNAAIGTKEQAFLMPGKRRLAVSLKTAIEAPAQKMDV